MPQLISLLILLILPPFLLFGAEGLIDYKIVKITPDQLPEIVKQNGPLEKLSAKDFSELISQLNPPKGHEAPRLLKTKYRARLQTQTVETKGQTTPALIGSAEWNIIQKAPTLQRLPLGELSIGLSVPRWQDGTMALITGGEQSSLFLESAGERTLNVDWSARGVSEAGELRWELRLPKSPVSEMELDLPDGWVPYTSQNDLIFTGPFPANDNLKAWKITFGGEVRLELVVRPPNQQKANLFHKLQSTHEVQIDKVISTSVFQIESQPSPVDEFLFTLDRALEVGQIRTNNLSQWTTTPTDNNKNQIKVKLTEPTRSAVLTFVCTQRGFLGDEWKLSPPNLVGSITTGLDLRTLFPEDLIGTDWKFGSYRMVQTSVNPSNIWMADFRPAPTQGELIPLSFRPKSVACIWNCKQETSWVPSDLDRIETSIWVDVIRGSLNKITLRVPSGMEVEQVEMGSIGVTATQGEGPTRLELNFSRPLGKADKEPIKLRLRLPVPKQTDGRSFPDIEPLGVRERSGSYRILTPVGTVLEARTVLSELPDTQAKSYSFGMAGVTGILDLRPSVGNLRTQAVTSLTPERISTRLTITPQSGKLSELVLVTPAEMKNWSQIGEQTTISSEILGITRLLSPSPSWASLGLPSRSVHRFRFSKPVEGTITLTGTGSGSQSQFVTLPTVLGSQMINEISCPNRYSLEVGNTPRRNESPSHFEKMVGAPSLVRVVPLETVATMHVFPVQLQTSWGITDRLKSLLKFKVLSESGGTLPIAWPENARLTSIKIGERSYPPRKDPLPIPSSNEPLIIEIEYDQPSQTGFVFCRLNPELPAIPSNSTGIEQTWVLASGWTNWNGGSWYQPNLFRKSDRFQTFVGQWWVSDTPERWRLMPNKMASFWVVNRSQLLALLVCGSILLSLTSLFFRRGTWILFVLSTSFLLISFWTPDILRPSFLLSAIILIGACFWLRKQERLREKITLIEKGIPVAVIVLIGFCFPMGASGAPETYTFYEVIEAGKSPSVFYVPAGFAEKVRASKNAPQLVGVTYNAKLEANIFKGEARFVIRTFDKGTRTIKVPLTGVRLRSAVLNGSEIFPTASADDGFDFEFKGSGEQNLSIQFEVISKPVGPEREFRFGVPEHPVTQLSLEADQSLRDLRLMAWRGVNRVTKTEKNEKIVADLGRVKFVSVRGRIPAKGVDLPLRSRSCNIWNIDGSFAAVNTTFDFDRIPSGGTTQVRLAVPEGLIVHDMNVRLTDVSALPVGIKSWRVSNERTKDDLPIVVVDFSEAISTRFRLVVQLVANTLLTNQGKARMVRCVNSQETESYLAIRFLKIEEASELEPTNTSEISAEAFQKKLAPLITGETTIAPVRSAYRRGTTGEPSVSFKTWPERNTLTADGILNAKHSPLGVSIQGTINLSGIGGSGFLELEGLGGIQSLAIFNNEIQSWNRVGSKAQIFLKKGQTTLSLNLVGWIPFAPKTEFVDIPSIRVKGAKSFSLKCKLTPAEGAILSPEKLVGGLVQDDVRDWTWTQALGETGGLRFRWIAAEAPPPLNLSLNLVNGEIQTTATILTAVLDTNRTHLFTVLWPESSTNRPKVNWPKEVRVSESNDKNARMWVIEIPSGVRVPQLSWRMTRPFTEQYAVPRIFSAPGNDNETRIQVESGLAINASEKTLRWRFGDPQTIKLSKDQQTLTKLDSIEVVSIPLKKGWLHQARVKGNSLKDIVIVWPTGSEVVQKVEKPEEGIWLWQTNDVKDFLPRLQDSNNQEIVAKIDWLIQPPEGVSLKNETLEEENTEGEFSRNEKYRGVIGSVPELQISHQANTTDQRMLWGVVLLVLAALALSLRPKGLSRVSHTLIALAVLISIFS